MNINTFQCFIQTTWIDWMRKPAQLIIQISIGLETYVIYFYIKHIA